MALPMDSLLSAVRTSLEGRGVLAKLRADLRLAVYTAIDEKERELGHHLGSRAQDLFCHDGDLRALAILIANFCDACGLTGTKSCLQAETGLVSEDLTTLPALSQLLQPRAPQPHAAQPKLAATPLLVALLEAARQVQAAALPPPSGAPETESAGSRAMPRPPQALWAGQTAGQQLGFTSAARSSPAATGNAAAQETSTHTPSQPSHVSAAGSPTCAMAALHGALAASPPPPPPQAASTFIRALARADSEEGDAAAGASACTAAPADPYSGSQYPQSPGHAITPLDDSPSFRRGAAAVVDAGGGLKVAAAAADAFSAPAQGTLAAAVQAGGPREPAAAASTMGLAAAEPPRPTAADDEADAYAEDSFASASASAAASPAAAPAVTRRSPQQASPPQPQSAASSTRQGFAVPDSAGASVPTSAGTEGDAYLGVEEDGADGAADSASVSGSYFRVDPHLVARAAQLRQAHRESLPGSESNSTVVASAAGLAAAAEAATFVTPAAAAAGTAGSAHGASPQAHAAAAVGSSPVCTAASPASPSGSATRRDEGAAEVGWLSRAQASASPPANEVVSPHGDSFGADHPHVSGSSSGITGASAPVAAAGLGSVTTTGAVAGGGAASGGRSSRDRFSGFSSDISSLTPSAGAAPVTQSSSAAGTPTGYAARSVEGEHGEDEQRTAERAADGDDAAAEAEREHGGYASHNAVGRGFRDGRRGAPDEREAAEKGAGEEGDVAERHWQRAREEGSSALWAAAPATSFQQQPPLPGRRPDSVPSITRSLGLQLGPIDLSDIEGGGEIAPATAPAAAASNGRQDASGGAGYRTLSGAAAGAADSHPATPLYQQHSGEAEGDDRELAHQRYRTQYEQEHEQRQYDEEGEGYGWGRGGDGDAAGLTAHFESPPGHLDGGEEAAAQLPHASASASAAASSSFSSSSGSNSGSGAPRSLSISRALGLGADLARLAREMHAQAASDEPTAEAGGAAELSQDGSGGVGRHWGEDMAYEAADADHHSAGDVEGDSTHEGGHDHYPSHAHEEAAVAEGQGGEGSGFGEYGQPLQQQQHQGDGGEGEDAAPLHGSAQRDPEPQEEGRPRLWAATPSPERAQRREAAPRQQRRLELHPASPQESVSAAAARLDASPSAVSPERGAEGAAAAAAAAGVSSPVIARLSGELSAAPSPASAASPSKRSRNRSDVTPILDDGTPNTAAEVPLQAAPRGVGAAEALHDFPSAEGWQPTSPDGGGGAVETEADGAAEDSVMAGGGVLRPRLGALEDADAAPAPLSPSSDSHPALRGGTVPVQASTAASSSAAAQGGLRAMRMGSGDASDEDEATLPHQQSESGSLKPGALLLASPLGARTRPVSIAESLVHSLRLPSMSSADEETDEESGEDGAGDEGGAGHSGDASGGEHSDAAVGTGQDASSAALSTATTAGAARPDSAAAVAAAQTRYFGVGDAAEESFEGASGADAERQGPHSSINNRQGSAGGSAGELEDEASPALQGGLMPTQLSVGRGRSLPGISSVSGTGPASVLADSSSEADDSRDGGDFRSSRAALKQRAVSAARSAASSAAASPLASDSPAAGRIHPRSGAHLDAPSTAFAGAGASTFLTAMASPDGGSSTDGSHPHLGEVAGGPSATPLSPEQRPGLAADDAAPESLNTPLSPVERSPAAKAPSYLAAALRGGGSSSTGAASASAAVGAEGATSAAPAASSAVEAAAPGAAGEAEAEDGVYGDDYEDEGWEDASASTSQAQGQTQQAAQANQLQAPAHAAVSPYARSTLVLPVVVSPPKPAATVVGVAVSVAPAVAKGLISVSQRPAGAASSGLGRRGHTGDSDEDDADDFELFTPGDVDASGSGEGLGLDFEGAHGAYDGAGLSAAGSRGAGALPAASSPESGSGPTAGKAEAPRDDDDADAPEVPEEEDLPDHDWF